MIVESVRKHCVRQFGVPSRSADFAIFDRSIAVLKWGADRTREGVDLYVTLGTSSQPMAGHGDDHRVEFYAGLFPPNDDIAKPLALLSFEASANGMKLDHGHSVSFPEQLWSGTEMHGFLLLRPRSTIIPDLSLAVGLHVEFLQAVPAFPSEIDFKSERGIAELLNRWEQRRVPFWDPRRVPDPPAAAPAR
jgi:hypothetical protein